MLTTQRKSRTDNPIPLPEIGEQSWPVVKSELTFTYSDDDVRDLKKYLSQIDEHVNETIEPKNGSPELKQLRKIRNHIKWWFRVEGI